MTAIEDRHRARRAFIRAHHPDRGGDPAQFIAGLARFEPSPIRVIIRPRRTWRSRLAAARRRLRRHPALRRVR